VLFESHARKVARAVAAATAVAGVVTDAEVAVAAAAVAAAERMSPHLLCCGRNDAEVDAHGCLHAELCKVCSAAGGVICSRLTSAAAVAATPSSKGIHHYRCGALHSLYINADATDDANVAGGVHGKGSAVPERLAAAAAALALQGLHGQLVTYRMLEALGLAPVAPMPLSSVASLCCLGIPPQHATVNRAASGSGLAGEARQSQQTQLTPLPPPPVPPLAGCTATLNTNATITGSLIGQFTGVSDAIAAAATSNHSTINVPYSQARAAEQQVTDTFKLDHREPTSPCEVGPRTAVISSRMVTSSHASTTDASKGDPLTLLSGPAVGSRVHSRHGGLSTTLTTSGPITSHARDAISHGTCHPRLQGQGPGAAATLCLPLSASSGRSAAARTPFRHVVGATSQRSGMCVGLRTMATSGSSTGGVAHREALGGPPPTSPSNRKRPDGVLPKIVNSFLIGAQPSSATRLPSLAVATLNRALSSGSVANFFANVGMQSLHRDGLGVHVGALAHDGSISTRNLHHLSGVITKCSPNRAAAH